MFNIQKKYSSLKKDLSFNEDRRVQILARQKFCRLQKVIYFKYKNMLHNISELSSDAVRSKFNILYDFHELEGLHPCGSARIHTIY